VFKGLRTP